jgi:hypothetical protein
MQLQNARQMCAVPRKVQASVRRPSFMNKNILRALKTMWQGILIRDSHCLHYSKLPL